MLQEPTIDKLNELRLTIMAEAWQQQQRDAKVGALSFDERFALLVRIPLHNYIGLEEVDDGIWSIFFANTLLARMDECDFIIQP